jgi:hypothetical protein
MAWKPNPCVAFGTIPASRYPACHFLEMARV